MSRSTRSKYSAENGVAIVEFALVLPLLMLLTLCVLELVHTTSAQKTVIQLSREAANFAFRYCATYPLPDPITRPDDFQTKMNILDGCLEKNRNDFQTWARININPNIVISMSYYELHPTTKGMNPKKYSQSSGDGAFPKGATRFSEANGKFYPSVTNITGQGLYVGEAWMRYDSLMGRLMGIFSYGVDGVYDSTVI